MEVDNTINLCITVLEAWRPLLYLTDITNVIDISDIEQVQSFIHYLTDTSDGPVIDHRTVVNSCMRLIEALGNAVLLMASFAGDGIKPHPVD